jgi:hypothetical protein
MIKITSEIDLEVNGKPLSKQHKTLIAAYVAVGLFWPLILLAALIRI